MKLIKKITNYFDKQSEHYEIAEHIYNNSNTREACIVVIKSSGGPSLTVWKAQLDNIEKIYTSDHTFGLDLWWNSMVARCEQHTGPLSREEFKKIVDKGDPKKYTKDFIRDFAFFSRDDHVQFQKFYGEHITSWRPQSVHPDNVAASAQAAYEIILESILKHAMSLYPSRNIILIGAPGFNNETVALKYFDYCWQGEDNNV